MLSTIALVVTTLLSAPDAPTTLSADQKAVKKTLKVLVNAIRYGKDGLAKKKIAFDEMAKRLMTDETFTKMSPAEQTELVSGLETIITRVSFEHGRGMFKYLDAVLYQPAQVEGDTAECASTVVVHRDLKKTEIGITYRLTKSNGKWRVFDTVMLDESTIEGVREDQVEPLLENGGVPNVMKALRAKVKELKAS